MITDCKIMLIVCCMYFKHGYVTNVTYTPTFIPDSMFQAHDIFNARQDVVHITYGLHQC